MSHVKTIVTVDNDVFRSNLTPPPVVLQAPEHPGGPGGPGGVERRRQVSRVSGPLLYAPRVPGLEESQAPPPETSRQRPAHQVRRTHRITTTNLVIFPNIASSLHMSWCACGAKHNQGLGNVIYLCIYIYRSESESMNLIFPIRLACAAYINLASQDRQLDIITCTNV